MSWGRDLQGQAGDKAAGLHGEALSRETYSTLLGPLLASAAGPGLLELPGILRSFRSPAFDVEAWFLNVELRTLS